MKKYIITGIAAAIAATSAMAGTAVSSKQVVAYEEPCLFRDNELQLDVFGLGNFYNSGGASTFNGVDLNSGMSGRPAWGGGLGINYFFARYFGVGIEQDIYGRRSGSNDAGDFGYTRWATIGNFFVRYPICSWNLAPYIMVGGGANYGNVPTRDTEVGTYRPSGQGFGHVGGGLEYRLTETIGLFTDARYLFSGVAALPDNQLMWRYGLRFAF